MPGKGLFITHFKPKCAHFIGIFLDSLQSAFVEISCFVHFTHFNRNNLFFRFRLIIKQWWIQGVHPPDGKSWFRHCQVRFFLERPMKCCYSRGADSHPVHLKHPLFRSCSIRPRPPWFVHCKLQSDLQRYEKRSLLYINLLIQFSFMC